MDNLPLPLFKKRGINKEFRKERNSCWGEILKLLDVQFKIILT